MATRAACYDVPKYHGRLWRQFAEKAEGVPEVVETGDKKVAGFGEGFLPEMFHRMFAETPREVPAAERTGGAAVRAKLHALASELPEVATLRRRTMHNDLWSGMAATSIAESVAKALPASKAPPPDADDAERVLRAIRSLAERDPSKAAELSGDLARAEGEARGLAFRAAESAEGIDESAVRTAMRDACETATEEIESARETLEAFGGGGYGTGSGSERDGDPRVSLALARKVASSAQLRRIVELAGRLKACATAKRATRTDFARSEIVGIEPTDDFANLVPFELGNLTHPLTMADLASRVIDRGAVGYELKGTEQAKKGPLVVGIDVSGSMSGDPDAWAKAVALALLDAARRDHRAFSVILFNGKVVARLDVPKAEEADPMKILALLCKEPFAGCDFDLPIVPCLDTIEANPGGVMGKADVVMITDCIIGPRYNAQAKKSMERANALGATVYGIIVGAEAEGLKAWCHEVTALTDVNADSKAVDLIFDGVLP